MTVDILFRWRHDAERYADRIGDAFDAAFTTENGSVLRVEGVEEVPSLDPRHVFARDVDDPLRFVVDTRDVVDVSAVEA